MEHPSLTMQSILENMSDLYEAGLFTGQEHTSAKTCVRQIPAAFKKIDWVPGTINLDYGGGKYDDASDYLRLFARVSNVVFDPFNRSQKRNGKVLELLKARKADSATICNVLNVIKESVVRQGVLLRVKRLVKYGCPVYISVYRGRGNTPTLTSRGWQENRPLATYLDEVKQVFRDAEIKNNMIIARN